MQSVEETERFCQDKRGRHVSTGERITCSKAKAKIQSSSLEDAEQPNKTVSKTVAKLWNVKTRSRWMAKGII